MTTWIEQPYQKNINAHHQESENLDEATALV